MTFLGVEGFVLSYVGVLALRIIVVLQGWINRSGNPLGSITLASLMPQGSWKVPS